VTFSVILLTNFFSLYLAIICYPVFFFSVSSTVILYTVDHHSSSDKVPVVTNGLRNYLKYTNSSCVKSVKLNKRQHYSKQKFQICDRS